LSLLVEAGGARFAIEATSVLEVAQSSGKPLQGIDVADLCELLGGTPEEQPGAAVVLDVSPSLAVRVRRVVEVADVAASPVLKLPSSLGEALKLTLRGALLHQEKAWLELAAEALPHRPHALPVPAPRPVYLLEELPERALFFESQGRRYGMPLPWISQVVAFSEAFCALPAPHAALGVFPHGQALWPVYTTTGLLGGKGEREPFLLLTELSGHQAAIGASRVLGVHGRLRATDVPGELAAEGLSGPGLFLDLQRMFS
jgi:hypothetical protein